MPELDFLREERIFKAMLLMKLKQNKLCMIRGCLHLLTVTLRRLFKCVDQFQVLFPSQHL